MKKILWLDTETTGLTEKHGLVQVAGIIDIDGVVKEEFDIKCAPFPNDAIDEGALKGQGRTITDVMAFPDPRKSFQHFEAVLGKYVDKFNREDKYIIAGHNVRFDIDMLQSWYKKNGSTYLGSYLNFKRVFDTMIVFQALQIVGEFEFPESNQLTTVANFLGVELDKAHDALNDIRATREVGLKLMARMKHNISQEIK